MKKILIIAGPNGAGKTTFAVEFLPHEAGVPEFVNADLIAAGLSPFQPEQVAFAAGRLMLERIQDLVDSGKSFAFETTLASRAYLRLVPEWQAPGYRVKLCFLRLPDADFAIHRVEQRVRMGGHDIHENTIRRRFARGWANLQQHYLKLVDEWVIYDSSQVPHRLLESGQKPPPATTLMEDTAAYSAAKEDANRGAVHVVGIDIRWHRARIVIIPHAAPDGVQRRIPLPQFKSRTTSSKSPANSRCQHSAFTPSAYGVDTSASKSATTRMRESSGGIRESCAARTVESGSRLRNGDWDNFEETARMRRAFR